MHVAPTESTAMVARTRSRSGASGPNSASTSASSRTRTRVKRSLPVSMACTDAEFCSHVLTGVSECNRAVSPGATRVEQAECGGVPPTRKYGLHGPKSLDPDLRAKQNGRRHADQGGAGISGRYSRERGGGAAMQDAGSPG